MLTLAEHVAELCPCTKHGDVGDLGGQEDVLGSAGSQDFTDFASITGNGVTGNPTTLLFTAGIDDEAHGLFGAIQAAS